MPSGCIYTTYTTYTTYATRTGPGGLAAFFDRHATPGNCHSDGVPQYLIWGWTTRRTA